MDFAQVNMALRRRRTQTRIGECVRRRAWVLTGAPIYPLSNEALLPERAGCRDRFVAG
jgi:hypothetical protein